MQCFLTLIIIIENEYIREKRRCINGTSKNFIGLQQDIRTPYIA